MALRLANRVYLSGGDFNRLDRSALEKSNLSAIGRPDEHSEGPLGTGQREALHAVKSAEPQLTTGLRFRDEDQHRRIWRNRSVSELIALRRVDSDAIGKLRTLLVPELPADQQYEKQSHDQCEAGPNQRRIFSADAR